jgi:hypothetical protein
MTATVRHVDAMRSIAARLRAPAFAVVAMALAGCSTDRANFPFTGSNTSAVPARPSAPPVNMAGRWLLMSPGRGQCNMTFGAASPNVAEGTIAPEGGCPGKFFTSRKWAFDSTGLVIRNHTGEPLAQLTGDGSQFTGQSAAGEPITLTR